MSEDEKDPDAGPSFENAEAYRGLAAHTEFNVDEDRARAAKAVERSEGKITDPFARFNLNLDGQNNEFIPKPGANLPTEIAPPTSPELARELTSPRMVELESGQKLNVITTNWGKLKQSGGRATVFLPSYNNAIGEGLTTYRLEELARETGRPTVAIDYPGMGKSEKLTKEQSQELKQNGFGEVARAELEALRKLGVHKVDLVGVSMGASAAASLAKEAGALGIEVGDIVLVETPGVTEMPLGKMGKSFMEEGELLDLYQSAPYDSGMRAASGQIGSGREKMVSLAKWIASVPRNDRRLLYARAMTRETTYGDLEEALGQQPQAELTLISGTESKISPHEANSRIRQRLASEHVGRVRHMIFPGEGHVVLEDAKRLADTVRTVLRS